MRSYGNFDYNKDPCGYFTYGKSKASTLSLSVLVLIEMLNAINALSEDSSICIFSSCYFYRRSNKLKKGFKTYVKTYYEK